MTDDLAAATFDAKTGLSGLYRAIDDASLSELCGLLETLPELRASLKDVAEKCEQAAGEKMGAKSVMVDGVEWVRSQPPDRRAWNHDGLLEAVLDSRLVDSQTGEVVEETPLERVRSVWPLPGYNARLTVLRERGIDPDLYATVSWDNRPWKVMRADQKRGKR